MNNPLFSGDDTDSRIGALTEQLNRQTDHLDSLTNSAVIIANGKIVLTYDASTTSYPYQTVPISSSVNNGFMAYLKRSDQPTKMYAIPYFEIIQATNTFLLSVYMEISSGVLQARAEIISTYTNPPATITIYYYVIQQAIDQIAS